MKISFKYILVGILWFMLFLPLQKAAKAQGLNTEIGFNDSHWQEVESIIVEDEFTYLVKAQMRSDSSDGDKSILLKIDTLGNILWEQDVLNSESWDFLWISKMIQAPNGNLMMIAREYACDIIACKRYLLSYSTSGNLLWQKAIDSVNCYASLSAMVHQNDTTFFAIEMEETNDTKIYKVADQGNFVDTFMVENLMIQNLKILPNGNFLANTDSALFEVNHHGIVQQQKQFTHKVNKFQWANGYIAAVTSDSVFLYSDTFTSLKAIKIPADTIRAIIYENNAWQVVAVTDSFTVNYTLNQDLEIIGEVQIPYRVSATDQFDFNTDHFAVGNHFKLYREQAIRLMDYSMKSHENFEVERSDVGVIDVEVYDIEYKEVASGVFSVRTKGKVLVKNHGKTLIDNCRVNHYREDGYCQSWYSSLVFPNMNLAPGDSMWVDMGDFHSSYAFSNGTDSLNQYICAYTSFPNQTTDLAVGNDVFCKKVFLGTVGITEAEYAKPKTLVKITDLSGREVPENSKFIQVRHYSDGTVEKVLRIE